MAEDSQCGRQTTLKTLRERGADGNAIAEVVQPIAGNDGPGNSPHRAQIVAVAVVMPVRFSEMRR